MTGRTIYTLRAGDFAEFAKTISESDVYQFAGITGDLNPAHINEPYASGTFFKTRIVHGMLLGGLISAVIGMKLPGPGTIYVRQDLLFKAPVFYEILSLQGLRLKLWTMKKTGSPYIPPALIRRAGQYWKGKQY